MGQISRELMLGAGHLPQFCWGPLRNVRSDFYAAYLHNLIPQKSKQGKSPHEITTGREPDLDLMFVKIFGCPCQYEPAHGVDHKRAAKTEWGWFVGIQWPMALVLRPGDNKVLSISRKKIHCHELVYARFDPSSGLKPQILVEDFVLSEKDIGEALDKAKLSTIVEPMQQLQRADPMHVEIPNHVLSIKCLSDYKRNTELNEAPAAAIPNNLKDLYGLVSQPEDLGECIPEPFKLDKDLLLEDIRKLKMATQHETLTDSIRRALNKLEEEILNSEPGRGA